MEQMGQMVKENLSYKHHHETLKYTLDNEKYSSIMRHPGW